MMTNPDSSPPAPVAPSSSRKRRATKVFGLISSHAAKALGLTSSYVSRNKDTITIYILILTLAASIVTAIYVHHDTRHALKQSHMDAETAERATFTSQLYSKQVD